MQYESPYASNRPRVPLDFVMLHFPTMPRWDDVYMLAVPLSHAVFCRLVDRAREHATSTCYDMGSTWQRGQLVNTSNKWLPKPEHEAWLRALASEAQVPYLSLVVCDSSIHYKRCKGLCINPEAPAGVADYVIFFNSTVKKENVGIWYRITALNVHDVLHPADAANPRWTHTCFACCNSSARTLLSCSACRKRYYCNEECQRRDWAVHKHEGLH